MPIDHFLAHSYSSPLAGSPIQEKTQNYASIPDLSSMLKNQSIQVFIVHVHLDVLKATNNHICLSTQPAISSSVYPSTTQLYKPEHDTLTQLFNISPNQYYHLNLKHIHFSLFPSSCTGYKLPPRAAARPRRGLQSKIQLWVQVQTLNRWQQSTVGLLFFLKSQWRR